MKENSIKPLPSRIWSSIKRFSQENDDEIGTFVAALFAAAIATGFIVFLHRLATPTVTDKQVKLAAQEDSTRVTVRATLNGALFEIGRAEVACSFASMNDDLNATLREASTEIVMKNGTTMTFSLTGMNEVGPAQKGTMVVKNVEEKKESMSANAMVGADLRHFRTNMTSFCGLALEAANIYKAEKGTDVYLRFVDVPGKSNLAMKGTIIGDSGTVIVLSEHKKQEEPKKDKSPKGEDKKTEFNAADVVMPLPRSFTKPLGPLFLANPS